MSTTQDLAQKLNKTCYNVLYRDGILWQDSDFLIEKNSVSVKPFRGCDPDNSEIVCKECSIQIEIFSCEWKFEAMKIYL